jgi:glutaconyl-CoA/methylmalonyl-CoA decarboxylase subunit gamma
MEEIIIKIDGKEHRVKVEESADGSIKVYLGKEIFNVSTKPEVLSELEREGQSKEKVKHGENVIVAPLPGTIIDVKIKVGDLVKEGDTLIKLVAMKMENEIIAPKNGKINSVKVKKNDNVNKGDILVVMG